MRESHADAIFWIAVVCCAVAQAAILRSVFAARGGAGTGAVAGGGTMPPLRRGLEVLWAVVPALGLALVLALTWRAMRPDDRTAPPPVAGPLTSLR